MQHLLGYMAIYAPQGERQKRALASFWTNKKLALSAYFERLYHKNNYILFSPDLQVDDFIQNRYTVITDNQMANEDNKKLLTTHLANNQHHKIVLDIDETFAKDSKLELKKDNIPENLVHFILTNAKGHVTFIAGKFFINNHHYRLGPRPKHIESVDTVGLTNVTSIGTYFLVHTEKLVSFDTAGLVSITSIGPEFLMDAKSLIYFYTSGLTSFESIGNYFLSSAKKLLLFDTASLTRLTSIDLGSLYGLKELRSFDTFGLMGLTYIPDYFLSNAKNLTAFNPAGLRNVTMIEEGFLEKSPWLEANRNKGIMIGSVKLDEVTS